MLGRLIALYLRMMIWLRYRIEIRGAQAIKNCGGMLFLSNHPAFVDPAINLSRLWPKFRMRPLVIDYVYHRPVLHFLFRCVVKGVPVPDFSRGSNSYKRMLADRTLATIVQGLRRGDNFLIYPSGRLQRTPEEQLGGASAVHEILQTVPEVPVVLMRVRGLWGSQFGWGLGREPKPGQLWPKMVWTILKNLILFTPRRQVTVELELTPPELPRRGTRWELNRWLEGWFNRSASGAGGPAEALTLVSYSCWREQLPVVTYRKPFQGVDIEGVSEEIKSDVLRIIGRLAKRSPDELRMDQHLFVDLGLDSLDIADLALSLTDAQGVPSDVRLDMMTVGGATALAAGLYDVGPPEPLPRLTGWQERGRPPAQMPPGETLHEVFWRTSKELGKWVACADGRSGVITYKRMRQAALVLAGEIGNLPGEKIGILLPASCAAQISVLATLFAGKIPVMLNWTAGVRALEAMKQQADVGTVLSSWSFLDFLDGPDLSPIHDEIVLLEDIRQRIGLLKKCWRGCRKPRSFGSGDDTAVILFTSGTEALPKGVPLSHRNILSNQRAAAPAVDFSGGDTLFSILPPFHSFGFTITGIFPVVAGARVFYSPKPTDGFRLAREMAAYKPTIICAAPTFLKGIKAASEPEQMASLRLVITGAEKAPRELFEWVEGLGTQMIEGYGITECSPILTLNRPGVAARGVGHPIEGVELQIVDPESHEPRGQGEAGLILVRGPNVFGGYLGDQSSPFIDGWFNTGDLGYLDKTGALHLEGRQKRFVKMGGEMISLPALEEVLEILGQGMRQRYLAVVALEHEGERPELHLFATFAVDVTRANELLVTAGMSPLAKLSATHRLDHMPLMGTGKVHLRKLQELAQEMLS